MYSILLRCFNKVSNMKIENRNFKQQNKYFNKIKNKNNTYINRSYAQYRCQCYIQKNIFTNVLLNIISFFLIPIFIVYVLTKKHKFRNEVIVGGKKAVNLGQRNCLPIELEKEFDIVEGKRNFMLEKDDIYFLLTEVLIKYPISFYFNLKIMLMISMHKYNIKLNGPNAMLVNSEFSFTSSITTKYLEKYNIEHINYMHGEKVYFIRDAFCKFSRFYVWDEYYIKLLSELGVYDRKFYISNIHEKYVNNNLNHKLNCKFKYYLQGESKEELDEIFKILSSLAKSGYSVKVRLHPRYSDGNLIKKVFNQKLDVEKGDIDINDSIDESEFIISKNSTVLYQGYLRGKKIIIDDVSNRRLYSLLSEYKYIMLNKDHQLLSKIYYNIEEKELENA